MGSEAFVSIWPLELLTLIVCQRTFWVGLVLSPSGSALRRLSHPKNGSSSEAMHFHRLCLAIFTDTFAALFNWLFPIEIVAWLNSNSFENFLKACDSLFVSRISFPGLNWSTYLYRCMRKRSFCSYVGTFDGLKLGVCVLSGRSLPSYECNDGIFQSCIPLLASPQSVDIDVQCLREI